MERRNQEFSKPSAPTWRSHRLSTGAFCPPIAKLPTTKILKWKLILLFQTNRLSGTILNVVALNYLLPKQATLVGIHLAGNLNARGNPQVYLRTILLYHLFPLLPICEWIVSFEETVVDETIKQQNWQVPHARTLLEFIANDENRLNHFLSHGWNIKA